MTKKEMIQAIQVAEAQAWKDYRIARKVMGDDDSITAKRRSEWCAVYDLREALGIESMSVESLMKKDLIVA